MDDLGGGKNPPLFLETHIYKLLCCTFHFPMNHGVDPSSLALLSYLGPLNSRTSDKVAGVAGSPLPQVEVGSNNQLAFT